MIPNAKLSVVLPVRDGQSTIAAEVERVLNSVEDMIGEAFEVILVDDGSHDATPEIMDELRARYPQVRTLRHDRARGLEAAGQTGLEKATGELVFIQEDTGPLRVEDLCKLYKMGSDQSVVAARAHSTSRSTNEPLLRRMKAWGARGTDSLRDHAAWGPASGGLSQNDNRIEEPVRGLQMIRRPHLQLLASRGGEKIKLETEQISSHQNAEMIG